MRLKQFSAKLASTAYLASNPEVTISQVEEYHSTWYTFCPVHQQSSSGGRYIFMLLGLGSSSSGNLTPNRLGNRLCGNSTLRIISKIYNQNDPVEIVPSA